MKVNIVAFVIHLMRFLEKCIIYVENSHNLAILNLETGDLDYNKSIQKPKMFSAGINIRQTYYLQIVVSLRCEFNCCIWQTTRHFLPNGVSDPARSPDNNGNFPSASHRKQSRDLNVYLKELSMYKDLSAVLFF